MKPTRMATNRLIRHADKALKAGNYNSARAYYREALAKMDELGVDSFEYRGSTHHISYLRSMLSQLGGW